MNFSKYSSKYDDFLNGLNPNVFSHDMAGGALFDLNISNSNDIVNQKSYNEAVLKYSGNEIFKFNLIAQENEIAIASEEIMNQYVGVHYNKIKEVFDKEKGSTDEIN